MYLKCIDNDTQMYSALISSRIESIKHYASRHDRETLSSSLAFCEGIHWPSVDSHHKMPVMRSSNVFFDVNLNVEWPVISDAMVLMSL